jgi:ABC-2 type transport system ATP-binding protein
MIEVHQLSKRYGDHIAVDRISFQARPGEIVGLLGPNGAGKTTTMRMLTGFMPPTSGTATIDGFDVVTQSLEARRRVGYMPERVPIYPDMTVEGFIRFWAELRGSRSPRAQVDAVLEQVALADRRKTLVRHLSKGMRQRLGLAQALVHRPPVIILDEPTIGIDPQQVIDVRESVRALGQAHTVLLSTHILSEAEQMCDRVVIINHGKLVAQGKPADLRRRLQPGAQIYVLVGGADKASARKLLGQIPGVKNVDPAPEGEGWVVSARDGQDLRAAISAAVNAAGLSLLEMRPLASSLEAIFLEVVTHAPEENV